MTVHDGPLTFEAALSRAIGLLASVSRQIDQMPVADPSPLAAYERLHLSTGALLAANRARHLLPCDLVLDEPIQAAPEEANDSPTSQVIATHELLIGQLQGVEPFELLELVAVVGNLCQEMRRHDRLH